MLSGTTVEISRVCLGCNVFGWTVDEKRAFEILDAFYGEGFNFIDTADSYPWWVNGSGGLSESFIGNWMKKRKNRHQIVVATKVGSNTSHLDYNVSKKHILKSAEESLKRLQTDCIDLYYTHFDDHKTPVEETLSAYDELIKAGKVKYIGASNISVKRLQESFDASKKYSLPSYIALQPHYNLIDRSGFEGSYRTLAEERKLSVFPYWSLASGFLTGKYRSSSDLSKSPRGEGIKKYLTPKNFQTLDKLDKVAVKYNTHSATVAIAWLLHQQIVSAPIVSATTQQQLFTTLNATRLKLDEEDVEWLSN